MQSRIHKTRKRSHVALCAKATEGGTRRRYRCAGCRKKDLNESPGV